VGPSSGAHHLAARELRARYQSLQCIVTFFYNEGEKYINDYFLAPGQPCADQRQDPASAAPFTPAAPAKSLG
jgi:hypothetical protein